MLKHSLTWVAIFGVIALMFLQLPPIVSRRDTVINTYATLVEVDALVKQKYVEPIHGNRLVDGAVRGMLQQLDPYSGYLSPEELPSFERRNAGNYIGVGVELGLRDGRLTIIAPLEDSPAARAGLLAGDRVLSVDGMDVAELSVFQAEDRLVGRPHSTVNLTVARSGADDPISFVVERGPVSVRTIRGFRREADGSWDYLIDPMSRVAYIRISNFRDNTIEDFDAVLRRLERAEFRSLILDLRFNPGGLMDAAIDMVNRFIDHGTIVSTVTRRRVVHEYAADAAGRTVDVPLVVLINGASASSAEIVAGSLQDHGRARLIGERTFGKGSVQHLLYLTDRDAAVKLTVAYYSLPSGRIIHRSSQASIADSWGVRPDEEIVLTEQEVRDIQRSRRELDTKLAERAATDSSFDQTSGPLQDGVDGRLAEIDAAPSEPPRDRSASVVIDRQLAAALRHLRAVTGQEANSSN